MHIAVCAYSCYYSTIYYIDHCTKKLPVLSGEYSEISSTSDKRGSLFLMEISIFSSEEGLASEANAH